MKRHSATAGTFWDEADAHISRTFDKSICWRAACAKVQERRKNLADGDDLTMNLGLSGGRLGLGKVNLP